jgi:acyl-CoA reductase-like NAD-dependent aldehyde dehydrogenase
MPWVPRTREQVIMIPMLIDGTQTRGDAADTMAVLNPATEETRAPVAAGSERDVDRAAAAAARSFLGWRQDGLDEFLQVKHVHWDWVGAKKPSGCPYGEAVA